MKKARIGETKVASWTDDDEEQMMNQPSLVCSVLK